MPFVLTYRQKLMQWKWVVREQRSIGDRQLTMDADAQIEQAVASGDARRLRRALAKGGSPGRTARSDGRTPLHLAAAAGNRELVAILLEKTTPKMLSKVDAAGYTPLMNAVEGNHLEVVKLLLKSGANANARDTDTGQTALRIAAGQGTLEMARILVEAGASPMIPGPLNLTPLDRARERKTPEGRLIVALFTRARQPEETSMNKRRSYKSRQ